MEERFIFSIPEFFPLKTAISKITKLNMEEQFIMIMD